MKTSGRLISTLRSVLKARVTSALISGQLSDYYSIRHSSTRLLAIYNCARKSIVSATLTCAFFSASNVMKVLLPFAPPFFAP
jgi:hypothetical protein